MLINWQQLRFEEAIDRLLEGGNIIHPLKVQFRSAIFGVLTGEFGIRWMLNYDKN
jgi:uncharacterized glyoxalase superfamily protein PhnB